MAEENEFPDWLRRVASKVPLDLESTKFQSLGLVDLDEVVERDMTASKLSGFLLDDQSKEKIRSDIKSLRRRQVIQSALWAKNFTNEQLLEQGFQLIEFALKGFDDLEEGKT